MRRTGSLPVWLGACPRVFAPPAPLGALPNILDAIGNWRGGAQVDLLVTPDMKAAP